VPEQLATAPAVPGGPATPGGKPVSAPGRLVNRAGRLATGKFAVLIVAVLVIGVVGESANGIFLTAANLVAVLESGVTTFIIGCAVTLVFTGGGLDLSVGAVFTLGGIAAAELMAKGVPWPIALLLGVGAGALLGLLNAALVIVGRVPPIIATLSTLYTVSGLALVVTAGNPVYPLPAGFDAIGQDRVGSLPWLVIYAAVVGIAFHVLLAKTRFGYDVQALGGNERAALANGVRVRRVKIQVYLISGAVAALAGILYCARTGTADPQAGGTDVTFSVITAVLIGGTSLFGGIGTIAGTALGALLFADTQNVLTVTGLNPLYQDIIVGGILAAAVAMDSWRRSRAFKIGSHG
jgi:ribose transport system permease protein